MSKPNDILRVYRGDTDLYFEEKRKYKLSYLKQVFRRRVQCCPRCSLSLELFPHLILQDGEGNLLKPELRIELVPYKPED